MSVAAGPRVKLPIHWPLAIAALACAFLIVWLRGHMPDLTAKSQPYPHVGQRGEKVGARNFSVEVKTTSPKTARAYLLAGRGSDAGPFRLGTSGLWVSAVVTVEALQEPGIVGARLRTRDGRFYPSAKSDRPALPGTNLADVILSPGLPRTGAYFFEVPADALEGLHMELFWNPHAPQPWDSVIDIDLGIDAARASALNAEAPSELDLRP